MHPKVDSVRDQAVDLMTNRGDHCRKVIEPKLSELNQRFAALSQRIKSGKVGRLASIWRCIQNGIYIRCAAKTTYGASVSPKAKLLKEKMKNLGMDFFFLKCRSCLVCLFICLFEFVCFVLRDFFHYYTIRTVH